MTGMKGAFFAFNDRHDWYEGAFLALNDDWHDRCIWPSIPLVLAWVSV